MSENQLQSRDIVITGGTSGIGYALVEALGARNRISVIGRASARSQALQEAFPDIRFHEADLARPDSVESAARAVLGDHACVDVLINNAAVQYTPQFLDDDFQPETIVSEVHVNLIAPALLIHALLPALKRSTAPLVLNINSGLGLVPKTGSAVYCATKAGLDSLSHALRNQFAGTHIRVAQAFLPLVDTQMTAGRGSGKLPASVAAAEIIRGVEAGRTEIDIGKVKILRWVMRLSPALARQIMRAA